MTKQNLDLALDTLRTKFQLNEFRAKQVEVIERLLSGRNVLALLPTGYGKSICYQVPSQILPGVTLVVSPLIALMQDQLAGLTRRGITNATVLNSSLDYQQISERIAGIKSGAYKLVYVAPERFDSPRFRELMKGMDVSLLVIDEAHCISQWGHDFRPQYRQLGDVVRELCGEKTVVLAVTATATPTVKRDIVKSLAMEMDIVEGSFDRPNLGFAVRAFTSAKIKDSFLFEQIRAIPGSTIVYASSRNETERLGKLLKASGLRAYFYHAGLDTAMRQKVQKAFETDRLDIIVSTVAFGMGIDKPNIRQVIHYNLPSAIEGYYQEAGRAGRDGELGLCTLMFQPKDIYVHKWLIGKREVDEELKRHEKQRLDRMVDYAHAQLCRRSQLLGYFGQAPNACERCDVCEPNIFQSMKNSIVRSNGQLSLPVH